MKTGEVIYHVPNLIDCLSVKIELEDMPAIEDFTDEEKGRIALEVLRSMKTRHCLKFVFYSEDITDKRIDIV